VQGAPQSSLGHVNTFVVIPDDPSTVSVLWLRSFDTSSLFEGQHRYRADPTYADSENDDMTSFPYPWGKTRPKAWRKALRHQLDEIASLRADAAKAFQQINNQCDDNELIIRQQIEFVDKVTSNGKYDSQVAEALLPSYRHVLRLDAPEEATVQSKAPLLRKSRAKVRVTKNAVMDIMRGVSPPSPVASIDHLVVDHKTLEPPVGFEQHALAGQNSGDSSVGQKHPTFGSSDSGEAALEAEQQEKTEKIARQNVFVSFEADAPNVIAQARVCVRHYDFSDPCDETQFPPELAPLYPKLEKIRDFRVVLPIDDMPEDEYYAWAKTVWHGHFPADEQEEKLTVDMMYYGTGKNFITNTKSMLLKHILHEHDRRLIWPWVRLRLQFVDTLTLNHESSSYSDDDLDSLAKFDYMVEGQVTPKQRRQYVQIIDLLQWPKETSRHELILRADPAYDLDLLYDYESLLDYSSDAGPAKNIPAWRRMREPRPASVDDALMRLYKKSGEARLV
jgi:hypothetical protein